jgi:transcriptional regulator with XRE-family HTH domain
MKRQAAKLVSVSENRREPTEREMQDPKTSLEDIGARLGLTRRALVLTRFQMARLIGIDVPTWGTYESSLERIPPEQALKLAAYGIPLDWIYEGRMTDLHPHVRDKIRELLKEPVKRGAP